MELRDEGGRQIEDVYRIDANGMVTPVITHEVDRPNGIAVSADDRFLYVADNNNATDGATKLWRFTLHRAGTITPHSRKRLFDWGSGRGPNGIALDQRGRLYVAGGREKPTRWETASE